MGRLMRHLHVLQRRLLMALEVEDVGAGHDNECQEDCTPEGEKDGDDFAGIGLWSHVAVANGEECDDCEPK